MGTKEPFVANPTNPPVDPTPTGIVDNPIKSTDFLATNKVTPTPKNVFTVGGRLVNLTNGDCSDPLNLFNS